MGAALEDWVNEDVVAYQSDFSSGTNGWSHNVGSPSLTFSSVSNELNVTATVNTNFQLVRSNTIEFGQLYSLTFEAFVEAGSGLAYWGVGAFHNKENTGNNISITEGVWQSVTLSFSRSSAGSSMRLAAFTTIDGDVTDAILNGKTVKLRNIEITQLTADGHVTTWYDQSGNGNNATQSTAGSQPKIVDGGAYLGELDFDGVDDQLDYPLSISTLNNTSSFVLAAFQNTTDNQFVLTVSGGSNNRWYSPIIWNGSYRFGYGASIDSINLGTPDENNHLFTATAGSTTAEGFIDGLSKGTQPSTSNALSDQSFIGAHTSSISYPLNGSISEIIIYDSDQSSNREAIETNINNHYDIY